MAKIQRERERERWTNIACLEQERLDIEAERGESQLMRDQMMEKNREKIRAKLFLAFQ